MRISRKFAKFVLCVGAFCLYYTPLSAQENYNAVVLKAAEQMDIHTLQEKIDSSADPGILTIAFYKRLKNCNSTQLNQLLGKTNFLSHSYKSIFNELLQRRLNPTSNYSMSQIQEILLKYSFLQNDSIVSLFRIEYMSRLKAMSDSELDKTYRACPLNTDIAQIAFNFLQMRKMGALQSSPQIINRPLETAAEAGDVDAQYNLGVVYQNGQGKPKDMSKAFFWYNKAANQGDVQAIFTVGDMYRTGQGAAQNDEKCFEYFQKAAAKGHPQALFFLGIMYHDAQNGVKQDYSQAFRYYEQASEKGFAKAQFNLALMYLNGEGTAKSNDIAISLFEKAAAQGHVNSKRMLEDLRKK